MTAWTSNGERLDIELAVALEIATQRLSTAETAAEHAAALLFNRLLWQTIRRVAATAPLLEDREALLSAAHAIDDLAGADETALGAVNRRHARTLAGRAATNGALGRILAAWNLYRAEDADAEFGSWLLERMDRRGGALSVG